MFDLNQNDKHELEGIVHSIGKDRAKKKGSSSSASGADKVDGIHKVATAFELYNLNYKAHLQFEKGKLAKKEKRP